MKYYLKELRVHHYIKNIMVFAALACSGELLSLDKLLDATLGFVAFCFTASAIYIINDIRDIEKDRKHPTKCNRPIAAGKIPISHAVIMMIILVIIAFVCNMAVFEPISSILLLLYFVLNLGYSLGLKNVPLVDITILVSGFLIRILYGALITNIEVSNWLYLTIIALAFYFALGKRRNELKRTGTGETRAVLNYYPESFLDKNMYMCLALANVFYALWSMDESTIARYDSNYLIWTVPIILLISMRYSYDVEGNSDGDPVEVLVHDKYLLFLCVIYLAVMFFILYL